MNRIIRWTDEASWDLTALGHEIKQRHGKRTAGKCVKKIIDDANQLLSFPNMGKQYKSLPTYRVLVSHLNSVYYHVTENEVIVVAVFDNRQNPSAIEATLTSRQ